MIGKLLFSAFPRRWGTWRRREAESGSGITVRLPLRRQCFVAI